MPTVLITGAGRGLGLEFARQYAADGWRVIATCRDPGQAKALALVEGEVAIHDLDVTEAGQVAALAKTLDGTAIDLLLNNAGVLPSAHFGSIDYDSWADCMAVNVLAPMRLCETFVAHVERSDLKKMVALTSKMGSIADNSGGGSYIYRASKAGLNAAMKSLAIDLAGRGIVACVLHPGWVRTDMGGPKGLIDAPESVAGMRRAIDRLDASVSGGFFAYDGAEVPW